jgi:hypothetical protein
MAKYLGTDAIEHLIEVRDRIFKERSDPYLKYTVDVLDNDVLSSLSIYEIVSQYLENYNINFARNGEDAMVGEVIIEQKCSNIKKPKDKAGFQFHAMGNLEYPRYIFAVRQKENLKILRLYDISTKENVAMVKNHLLEERRLWLERGRLDESKMKRDVILLPEKTLLENLTIEAQLTINECEVHRA